MALEASWNYIMFIPIFVKISQMVQTFNYVRKNTHTHTHIELRYHRPAFFLYRKEGVLNSTVFGCPGVRKNSYQVSLKSINWMKRLTGGTRRRAHTEMAISKVYLFTYFLFTFVSLRRKVVLKRSPYHAVITLGLNTNTNCFILFCIRWMLDRRHRKNCCAVKSLRVRSNKWR